MIITVSGAPGTGTTTLSRSLSNELGIRWVNTGELFRKIAAEKGLTVKDLNKIAERGPEIDYLVDDAQKNLAKEDHGIFEGRLSGYLLKADLKIMLKTDLKLRAERISKREAKLFEDALHEVKFREESEARRYEKYYNFDISNLSIYDLVIDTGRFNEHGTLAIALAAARALKV